MDNTTLYKIGYGLYVLTAQDGGRDNGCIVNTVMQITSNPPFVGVVSVSKENFTHDLILNSKRFNISALTIEAPFDVFKRFGFQSGATLDKFAGFTGIARSKNGLIYLTDYANAYLSFSVIETFDFGSHTMFKSDITDGEVLGGAESVTYAYYQQHIKPISQPGQKSGYRCKVCNYVYEGSVLPKDFICPLCKHGVGDFVKI